MQQFIKFIDNFITLNNMSFSHSQTAKQELVQNKFYKQNESQSGGFSQQNKFDRLKFLKNLRIQQDVRRLKSCLQMQKQTKKNLKQRNKIETQIKKYQQFLKQKKKQFIFQKLEQVQVRKKQRQQINNLTNKELFQIKKKNQFRRNKLESIVKQYRQQEQEKYANVINQRKIYRVPIKIQQLKQHQRVYLHHKLQNQKLSSQNTQSMKKQKFKMKTQFTESNVAAIQNSNVAALQNSNVAALQSRASKRVKLQIQQAKNKELTKRRQIIAMIFKRNQYGNRKEQEINKKQNLKPNKTRAKTQFSSRNQQYDQSDSKWKKIMEDSNYKKIIRKAKLQTNNSIVDWKQGSSFEIRNIQSNGILEDMQKVKRLNILEQKYKYLQILKNGNPQAQQALQLRTQANIAKANLLLRHQY